MFAFNNSQELRDEVCDWASRYVEDIRSSGHDGALMGPFEPFDDPMEVANEFSLSASLLLIGSRIFVSLSRDDALTFIVDFWGAMRPGIDLGRVTGQYIIWHSINPVDGVIHTLPPADKQAMSDSVQLHTRALEGDEPSLTKWNLSIARMKQMMDGRITDYLEQLNPYGKSYASPEEELSALVVASIAVHHDDQIRKLVDFQESIDYSPAHAIRQRDKLLQLLRDEEPQPSLAD